MENVTDKTPTPAPAVSTVEPTPPAAVSGAVSDTPAMESEEGKPAYKLPECSVYECWTACESIDSFTPDSRQKMVIDAVQIAKNEGLFYTSDVFNRCVELLNVSESLKSIELDRVEHGSVGMDIYYASEHIEAKKRYEASKKTSFEMAIRVGDDLGTLVFTDYKRTTGVTITGVNDAGFQFTGKRGAYTVTGTGCADQFKCAIERAFSTGKRKTDYAKFVESQANRKAPTPAPAVISVTPTPPVAVSKPKTIEEADAAIHAHAMASEFNDYFSAEKSAHDRHEIVGQWRGQFIGSYFELIASNDIACTDYQKLWLLVDNGKLTFERACEMIDSAVSAGIFDGKTGEYIKKNIAPTPAPAVISAEATPPAAESTDTPDTPSAESTEAPAVTPPEVPAAQTIESGEWTSERCEATLKAQQADDRPTITAKSGAYCAWFFMLTSGAFGLRFAVPGQPDITAEFATWHDRMVAVQSMGRAIDYPPTDSPAAGQDAPTIADSEPVATTAPAVSAEELTPVSAVSTEETEAAEDAATLAIIKARESSAKVQAAIAYTQALTELPGQYPDLKLAKDNPSQGGKLAATNARILLKQAFKGIKFSVRSSYSKVWIEWTDGPTDAQVNEIVGRFDIGASDTQTDYFYTIETAFSKLFGGVQYMTTKRNESNDLVQQAIDALYPDTTKKPTVSDWHEHKGEFSWRDDKDWEIRRMREMLGSISKM